MRVLACILLFACAPAWARCVIEGRILDDLPDMSCHAPNLVASGQPAPADIERLKRAGIQLVIDLSKDSETPDFDEAVAVRAAGIEFRNLPIDGAAGLTSERIVEFDRLINEAGDRPTLIHGASSNRVGALMALRAAELQGQSPEAAIEIGKEWGLDSLEPDVRQKLAQRDTGEVREQANEEAMEGAMEDAKEEVKEEVKEKANKAARKATPAPAAKVTSVPVFPRIKLAGGVYILPKTVTMPAAKGKYRLVIDATTDDVTGAGINRDLESAARALNLYALAGVPAKRVKLAVVIHGKAVAAVLAEASYRKKFGKPNPNAALIAELNQAGVRIVLCGQAMVHAGLTQAEVRGDVGVELSAMTALVDLQKDGYELIP